MKILLKNSRTTDSSIAKELGISSQAVGKIRRKLEENVINSYGIGLNYYKMGISIFAISIAKLTKEGMDTGELEVENELLENPHIISVYRIPKGSSTHIIMYGFQSMNELDDFFHSFEMKRKLHSLIETQEIFTFSHNSLIKNDPIQLFNKVINSHENGIGDIKFDEIEKFKKRL